MIDEKAIAVCESDPILISKGPATPVESDCSDLLTRAERRVEDF